jgi:hypothetical protein
LSGRLARRALLGALPWLPACGVVAQTLPSAGPFSLRAPRLHAARAWGLRAMGGLVLDTTAWRFGGFSGLYLEPDLTLTAVSDRGRWWQGALRLDAEGRPRAVDAIRHGRLHDARGRPLRGIRHFDAEAMTRLDTGDWLVGFERRHRIQRHARLDGPGRAFPTPPGLTLAPSNAGLEALTQMADGRLLALTEGLRGSEPHLRRAWLGRMAGNRVTWETRDYQPEAGMQPTGAAALPDGGALVVERDFSLFGGFRCRLARVPAAAFAGAGLLTGETLLEMPGDAPADNWECVAVAAQGARMRIALISDDNERRAQRSMVLLYERG